MSQLKTKKYYPNRCIAKNAKDVNNLHEKIMTAKTKNENEKINENQRW